MDAFFNTLKKGLVAMMFIIVGFSMTYVPQLPSSHVPLAEAQRATFPMQVVQNASALAGNVQASITAFNTGSLWAKENIFDRIGWTVAKAIVSGMVRSLINWINSGFQGSPAFVTDLKGFLISAVDEEFGRVISEMGDLGSFICSPFRLDVQISLETQYARSRATGQSAPTCTATGIMNNIEGFISGIDPGNGLSDWLEITSTPQTNTPYGAVLNAEVAARARLINAEGQELTQVNWGDGFLSQKICQAVGGDGGQQCTITKPGRIIADQLNKALGAGQDALIEADEINEVIAALLGQLANQAMTRLSGLLGLSEGTGYTSRAAGYSGSYLDAMVDESTMIVADAGDEGSQDIITPRTQRQIEYRDLLVTYQTQFQAFLDEPIPELNQSNESGENQSQSAANQISRSALLANRQNVQNELANLTAEIGQTNDRLANMLDMGYRFNQATSEEQTEILLGFTTMPTMTDYEITTERTRLSTVASNNNVTNPVTIQTDNLTELLAAVDPTVTVDPSDPNWGLLATRLNLSVQ